MHASSAPVQQQAGQVDAGDEQQQRDGAGEHGNRRRHFPDHAVGERDDGRGAAALIGLRMFQGERGRDVLHFGTRRGHVDSGLEPADGIVVRATVALHPAVVRRHLRLEQQIHLGRVHVTKAWWQDTNHGVWPAVQGDRLADRGRRAAELPHRKGVAHDRRRCGVGPGIGWLEETALKRPGAEHAKEVHGHALRVEPLREFAARDEHPVGQRARDAIERGGALAPVVEVRPGDAGALLFGQKDQALRVCIGQRPHQHRIRDRENRRRRADAEDEHGQRREREARRAPQQPRTVSHIAPDRVEPGRADVTGGFDRLRQPSQIAEGQPASLFGRDTTPAVRFDLALEVVLNLLENLGVDAAAAEQSTSEAMARMMRAIIPVLPGRAASTAQTPARSRFPRGGAYGPRG